MVKNELAKRSAEALGWKCQHRRTGRWIDGMSLEIQPLKTVAGRASTSLLVSCAGAPVIVCKSSAVLVQGQSRAQTAAAETFSSLSSLSDC